jgi:hypothetical protein
MKEAITLVAADAAALGPATLYTSALTRCAIAATVRAKRGRRSRSLTRPIFARNFRRTCRVIRTHPGLLFAGHLAEAYARHVGSVSTLVEFAHE